MTFPSTTNPINEVPPATLQGPGGVAHKEQGLMSIENRTDHDPKTTTNPEDGRTIHVRLTDAEYATLVGRASANHRTVAGQVRHDLATTTAGTEVPA